MAHQYSDYATDWTTEEPEFDCRRGHEISLLSSAKTGSVTHPAFYSMAPGQVANMHLMTKLGVRGAVPPLPTS
jgi:hypothetical protein